MRYAHYLTSPRKVAWPSAVICASCELIRHSGCTTNTDLTSALTAWHASYLIQHKESYKLEKQICGRHAEEFWAALSTLLTEQTSLWILSDHCGDVWHALGFWEMLEDGHIKLFGTDPRCSGQASGMRCNRRDGYLCIEDPPNIAKFRLRDCKRAITWVDIRNYGVSLDAARNTAESTCMLLSDWFTAAATIVRDNKLGAWQATVGSQAMHGWRYGYKSHGVFAHVHPQTLALESAAYYGGRCEAYHIGTLYGQWHQLDFRSMYPAICAASALPCRLRYYSNNCFECYQTAEQNAPSCIAEVTIETDVPAYPYRAHLPLQLNGKSSGSSGRHPPASRDTDIIYPIGRFDTALCGPELTHALENNHVRDIHCIAEYEMEPALRDYAERLYGVRQACSVHSVTGIEHFVKALLVSLPGKLGQRERLWIDCPGHSTDVRYGSWYGTDSTGHTARYRSIAGHVQRDVALGFTSDAIPAIAGFVTSASRTRLLCAIRTAGNANCVYVDTDGLICNDDGFRNIEYADMMRKDELGFLRWLQSADGCTIHGVKHYEIGEKVRNAGVPRKESNGKSSGHDSGQRRRITEDLYSRKRPSYSYNDVSRNGTALYRGGKVRKDGSVRPWVIRNGNVT